MGGDAACFQSTRLRYLNPERACPVLFEMLRVENEISTFLSLSRSRWTSSDTLTATLRIDSQEFQETLPVLEGRMRLRLPPSATTRIISALQAGTEVVILIDGFEEKLRPEQFNSYFEKFTGRGFSLNNFLKGPF